MVSHSEVEPMKTGRKTFLLVAASAGLVLGAAAASAQQQNPPTLTQEQIKQILASPDRSAADRTNDLRRKPEEMLVFIGVRPGMTALDLSAAGGYTTELIARAVGIWRIGNTSPDRRSVPARGSRTGRIQARLRRQLSAQSV